MEIKFRALHKHTKKYHEVVAINFLYKNISVLDDNKIRMVLSLDDFILEQYTGLKDKNGKEIYVGDVVKYTHEWEVDEVENEIAVVEFEDGGFSPMQLANGGTYYGLEGVPVYEVISNVHVEEEK